MSGVINFYGGNVPKDISAFNNDAGYVTNDTVIINQDYPSTGTIDGTMADLITDINADENAVTGKSYLKTVSISDLPGGLLQAEMLVEVMQDDPSLGKVLVFTVTSNNTAPYHGEYTSAYGASGTWRSWSTTVQNPTNNHLVKVNASGELIDAGLAMVKMTKTEYDALVTKDPSTVYFVDCTPASFGGLEICPAPLYYGANGFEIKDSDWNHSSYQQHYGKVEGSYLFTFIELGSYFDSDGDSFATTSGSIDNANTIDGWRVPTEAEFVSVLTTNANVRPGSTVNGASGKHYSMISYNSTGMGLLIYPDGFSYELPGLVNFDSTTVNTLTVDQINALVSSGCAFLPKMGRCSGGSWYDWGVYWYATEMSGNVSFAKCLYFETSMNAQDKESKLGYYNSVRLVRTIQPSQQVQKLYLGSILIADSSHS